MSNVIQMFANTNNVIDFATKKPFSQEASNVDNSLEARRAKRAGLTTDSRDNVVVAFYPQSCA